MTRTAVYVRVSTLDQHPETQQLELRSLAQQRGLDIIKEYVDHGISGARSKRPALDELLADARRRRFDLVIVWPAIAWPAPPSTSWKCWTSSIIWGSSLSACVKISTPPDRWAVPSSRSSARSLS